MQQIQFLMFKDRSTHIPSQKASSKMSPEIISLMRQIKHFLKDNKDLYDEIKKLDPNFTFKLYQPINCQGIDQMFIKPLIIRQLDQLMDQKEILVKKRQMTSFRLSSSRKNGQKQLVSIQNHFGFLRTMWPRIQTTKPINSGQKIDNLNKIIGMTKLNIKNIIEKQQQIIKKDMNLSSNKTLYLQLKLKEKSNQDIQRLKMRNQQLQMRHIQLQQVIMEKQMKIDELEKQLNETQKKLNKTITNLNDINVKLMTLQNEMLTETCQVRKNKQNLIESQKYLEFSGVSEDLKVKIYSSNMIEVNLQQTSRNLIQILEFLRSRHPIKQNNIRKINSCQTDQSIPSLNLNESISTNQNSLSERYFSKKERFIPIKTQRSSLINNKRVKTVVNCQSTVEQCEQGQKLEGIDNVIKKFSRKVGDFPLTSDRFRKIAQKKTLDLERKSISEFSNQVN